MKPVNSSTLPALKMKNVNGEATEIFHAPGNKIAWVRTVADKPGASFRFVVRDALGRVMVDRPNCKTETAEFGEMMNIPVRMGEDFQVSLEDIQGAENIDLYLN